MNKTMLFAVVASSVVGVTVGTLIGVLSTKKKFEDQANKDIESVKNEFRKLKVENSTEAPITDDTKPEEHITKIEDMYIISPDDFGEIENYEKVTLTYTTDGVLLDDNDEPVEHSEDIVGTDFMHYFGKYEDDAVYIRNDVRRCDYEILREYRVYAEIVRRLGYTED